MKNEYNENKRSSLMKLMIAFKSETDEKERQKIKKQLRDEMYKFAYFYGIKDSAIGQYKAADFLLDVESEFDSIIDKFNKVEKVDFVFYFKKILAIRRSAFYKKQSYASRMETASISVLLPELTDNRTSKDVSERALSDKNITSLYSVNNLNNKALEKLLNRKNVQEYILSSSTHIDAEMITKAIDYLPVEERRSFIEKYIIINKNCTSFDDKQKALKYLVKKRNYELLEDESFNAEIKRCALLSKKALKNNLNATKVPYSYLSKLLKKDKKIISSGIFQGKNAIIEYKKENRQKGVLI